MRSKRLSLEKLDGCKEDEGGDGLVPDTEIIDTENPEEVSAVLEGVEGVEPDASEDELQEKFDEEVEVAQEALQELVRLSAIGNKLQTSMNVDAELLKAGKFSKEHLAVSIESFMTMSSDLGYNYAPAFESLSFESADGVTLAIEALDGGRQGLLARITKSFKNGWEGLTATFSDLDATAKILRSFNEKKLKDILAEIESGARKPSSSYNPVNTAVSKKLAIYYAMGNQNFDVNSVITQINMAYNLIVEKKLFTDGCKYVVEALSVGWEDAKEIPVFKPSIDVVDKFTLPEIRKWLNRDTKAAVVSEFIGHKFNITSVYQNASETDCRNDYYTVPSEMYAKKETPMLKQQDIVKLLKAGIDLAPKGIKLAEVGKAEYWKKFRETMYNNVKNSLMSGNLMGSIINGPAAANWNNCRNYWVEGVIRSLLHLKKSHLDSGTLIFDIANKMYPKA